MEIPVDPSVHSLDEQLSLVIQIHALGQDIAKATSRCIGMQEVELWLEVVAKGWDGVPVHLLEAELVRDGLLLLVVVRDSLMLRVVVLAGGLLVVVVWAGLLAVVEVAACLSVVVVVWLDNGN